MGEESHMTNVVDMELVHEWETEREGGREEELERYVRREGGNKYESGVW